MTLLGVTSRTPLTAPFKEDGDTHTDLRVGDRRRGTRRREGGNAKVEDRKDRQKGNSKERGGKVEEDRKENRGSVRDEGIKQKN